MAQLVTRPRWSAGADGRLPWTHQQSLPLVPEHWPSLCACAPHYTRHEDFPSNADAPISPLQSINFWQKFILKGTYGRFSLETGCSVFVNAPGLRDPVVMRVWSDFYWILVRKFCLRHQNMSWLAWLFWGSVSGGCLNKVVCLYV